MSCIPFLLGKSIGNEKSIMIDKEIALPINWPLSYNLCVFGYSKITSITPTIKAKTVPGVKIQSMPIEVPINIPISIPSTTHLSATPHTQLPVGFSPIAVNTTQDNGQFSNYALLGIPVILGIGIGLIAVRKAYKNFSPVLKLSQHMEEVTHPDFINPMSPNSEFSSGLAGDEAHDTSPI